MVRLGFGQREVGFEKGLAGKFGFVYSLRTPPPPPPPPPKKKKKKKTRNKTQNTKNKKQNKKRVMHLQCCCFAHTPYLFLDATVRRRQRGQYITKRFNERKKCLCTSLNIWGNFSTVLCEKTTLLT